MKNTCLTVSKICKVTVHSGCQMVYVGSRVISNVILTVSMFDISPSRMLSCESQPDCCTQVQGVPCQIIHRWLQTHLSGTFSDYPRLLHGAYLELDFVPWVICLQYIYIYIYVYICIYSNGDPYLKSSCNFSYTDAASFLLYTFITCLLHKNILIIFF